MAAQTKARAMPVLPEVGSTITLSAFSWPARSAASTMASAMRSLTEDSGLKNSSLTSTSARQPASAGSRLSRTSGVSPIASQIDPKIRPRSGGGWPADPEGKSMAPLLRRASGPHYPSRVGASSAALR